MVSGHCSLIPGLFWGGGGRTPFRPVVSKGIPSQACIQESTSVRPVAGGAPSSLYRQAPPRAHASCGRAEELSCKIYICFRLFRNVSKPRPNDHPILIVFVVGGVTATEVRLIKELAAKTNLQVSYLFINFNSVTFEAMIVSKLALKYRKEEIVTFTIFADHVRSTREGNVFRW